MTGTIQYACPGFVYAIGGFPLMPVNLRKADAYSAGATLFEMMAGHLPVPLAEDASDAEYVNYFERRVGFVFTGHLRLAAASV